MINIKLILEYDGTDFYGWQMQPNKRTVQGEIEKALLELLREEVRIIGSGRTDTGVHALNQVANFLTNSDLKPEKIKNGLNGILSKDIYVKSSEKTFEKFNSRFSALTRTYKYVISKGRTALNRRYCWEIFYSLDSESIKKCCELIIGEKDFKSFAKLDKDRKNSICNVKSTEWIEKPDYYIFKIESNRFLHKMVRSIVGTFIDIGKKKITPDDFLKILEGKDRRKAGMTVPAKGLFLECVTYPNPLKNE
jgi:tRNA pseudouridine38-40 synthase